LSEDLDIGKERVIRGFVEGVSSTRDDRAKVTERGNLMVGRNVKVRWRGDGTVKRDMRRKGEKWSPKKLIEDSKLSLTTFGT
jgi:hypothetical protein